MLLAQGVELVDDRVYRGDLATLALELGPELRILSESSSETPVVIANVLHRLLLVECRGHEIPSASFGGNCSTYGTSRSTRLLLWTSKTRAFAGKLTRTRRSRFGSAPWRKGYGPEWSRGVARLRYTAGGRLWTLYSSDRNGRWHRYYSPVGSTPDIHVLLDEIDRDPTCIFWADANLDRARVVSKLFPSLRPRGHHLDRHGPAGWADESEVGAVDERSAAREFANLHSEPSCV